MSTMQTETRAVIEGDRKGIVMMRVGSSMAGYSRIPLS